MKNTSLLAAALCCGLLLLTGCFANVPATKIGVNPSTGQFSIDSPKEIDATNLDITLPNGASFHAGSLKSHNSPDVISAQAAANAAAADRLLQGLDKANALVDKVGLKAATSGLAP